MQGRYTLQCAVAKKMGCCQEVLRHLEAELIIEGAEYKYTNISTILPVSSNLDPSRRFLVQRLGRREVRNRMCSLIGRFQAGVAGTF